MQSLPNLVYVSTAQIEWNCSDGNFCGRQYKVGAPNSRPILET